MRRCVSLFAAFLALSMFALVAPACGDTDDKLGDEKCDNREDDDADGLTDCADPDCSAAAACTDVGVEHCYNLVDDDNDGDVDCDDSECASTITCVDTYESCATPGDEDVDGASDCEDEDCVNTATCTIGAEACGNKIDDDGDGEVDCEDEDCANTSECQAQPEDCSNETDDDSDGEVDCDDSDCANTAACIEGGEQCGGGQDEDGDGRIDCADTDCAYTRSCIGTLEICTNGIDDDADGAADCADPDCEEAVVCLNRREDCTNRIDDDGDGDIDCVDADCASEPVCTDEICDNGVDDDGDGNADCKDYDCARDASVCTCENLADVDNDGIPNCTDEDIDGDGVANDDDNCDFVENAEQDDVDGDGIGDVCETDIDADGVIDDEDNCPGVFNPDQENQDAAEETADPNEEVMGDACEDSDADGWPDLEDNCPNAYNPSQSTTLSQGSRGDACASGFYIGYLQRFANATHLGRTVDTGDTNGDGEVDLLFSAANETGSLEDQAYLAFGPLPLDIGRLSASYIRTDVTDIVPANATSENPFAYDVAVLGDLNGDGRDDYALSTFAQSAADSFVYVFDGTSTYAESRDESSAMTSISSPLNGFGFRLSATDDLTGDSIGDLMVVGYDIAGCSFSALLFSGADLAANASLDETNAVFTLEVDFACGSPPRVNLAAAGSIIGDSTPDPVVTVTRTVDGSGGVVDTGRIFVFDGANLPSGTVNSAPVELSGPTAGEEVGRFVATDGDFDGDGVNDLVVVSETSTKAYIWKGVSGGNITGVPDAEITGPDSLGGPVTLGLDFDQDGIDDLITSGPGGNTSNYQMLRIVSGRTLGGTSSGIDVTNGISVRNSNEDIGLSLNVDLDVDGDGLRDVMIGAPDRYYLLLTPRRTAP